MVQTNVEGEGCAQSLMTSLNLPPYIWVRATVLATTLPCKHAILPTPAELHSHVRQHWVFECTACIKARGESA